MIKAKDLYTNKLNRASTIFSVFLHVIIMLLFFLLGAYNPAKENLIEISYGEPGGGSGGFGEMVNPNAIVQKPLEEESEKDAKPSENVPDVKNSASDEKIKVSDTKPAITKKGSTVSGTAKPAGSNREGKGIGNGTGTGSGTGNGNGNGMGNGLGDGFGIDWGGAVRKIYNYNIPKYPDGVSKEIDIKLKFSILPDGSVNNISVLRKADALLERTAVEALKYWRFEPLPANSKQVTQTAIITFPFRLD